MVFLQMLSLGSSTTLAPVQELTQLKLSSFFAGAPEQLMQDEALL
jgi:hypothetical protein